MKKADHELLVGRSIAGKFVVESLIGTGAMGAVFRARQVALEKTVAIKVMHGEHAKDPAFAGRFHREAKAASRLNHPNSIQVLDFGAEPDGLLYIAMEYLDGRSLHRLLKDEWPLAPARIADILMQALAALAVAHDLGVVHRDLKPENVMVLSGTDDDGLPKDIVKVCDFGIAKITDPRAYRVNGERESDAPVTTAGFLVGTPEYMSPEQGRGEKLDPRSDLYSVGVILYEMLTKRVPFDAENAIGVVLKHITEEPLAPSKIVAGLDPRLEAITLRALRKFREERYPSAREMRAELRPVAETHGVVVSMGAQVSASPAETMNLANATTIAMAVADLVTPASLVTSASPITPASPVTSSSHGTGPKPTLQGTTAAVERPARRHRGWMLIGVVAAALVTGASGTAFMLRKAPKVAVHAAPAALPAPFAPAVVTASPVVPRQHAETAQPVETARPGGAAQPAASEESPSTAASSRALTAAARTKGAVAVSPPPKGALAATATSAMVATPGLAASVAPAASGAPSASASASAAAPVASVALGPSASAPSDPAPAADPTFDPEKAYVEIGMINAEGVKEHGVRGALHALNLAQCYRAALRARAARATGVATLNLSFDEAGQARSAVLTGAEFLPEVSRCVQDTAAAMHVDHAQVDQGGGVAEVTLGFREP